MKYFLDNCISPYYADMLRALEVEATPLVERFAANTSDEVFLPQIGDFDILLSHDRKQTTRVRELIAFRASGVTGLYLERFWGRLEFWGQALWLVRFWPTIDAFAVADGKSGRTFMVSQQCRFTEVRR